MENRIDLDELEEHYNNAPLWDSSMDPVYSVLPALIAELRELRARTTPEVIGEKHRDGNWWLCWEPGYEAWYKIRWQHERWQWGGGPLYGTPTHALPLPPAPEACP